MNAFLGMLFLLMIAVSIGRLIYPSLRLRWLRRQLAIIDALRSAEAELANLEARAEVDAIAGALEAGTLTGAQALERTRRRQDDADRARQEMHPVYLRRARLELEYRRRAPLREVDAVLRRLEALVADPATPAHARAAHENELLMLRMQRDLRPQEIPDWFVVVVVAGFLALIARAAYRQGLFG